MQDTLPRIKHLYRTLPDFKLPQYNISSLPSSLPFPTLQADIKLPQRIPQPLGLCRCFRGEEPDAVAFVGEPATEAGVLLEEGDTMFCPPTSSSCKHQNKEIVSLLDAQL